MATIQSSIQLMDGMSRPLNAIINSVNTTISALQRVNNTDVNIDTTGLAQAQLELQQAGANLKAIEEDVGQAILANTNAQNKFNNSLHEGVGGAGKLMSSIKKLFGVYVGAKTLMGSVNLSDTLTQNTARLNLLVEQKPIKNYPENSEGTLSIDTNSAQENLTQVHLLQNEIFDAAARSRGDYLGMSDGIGKMGLTAGDAFNNTSEIVGFMELINKQFKISGTNAQGVDAAMLQLTQAMGAGVLRGEELNSIFEQAPLIIKNIANYMGVPIGQIKQLASEGKLTSDIVKAAMFNAADDINAKFESIPKTFSDGTTAIKNTFVREFDPIAKKISNIINSRDFQVTTNFIIGSMKSIIGATVTVFDVTSKVIGGIKAHWNAIGPAIGFVTSMVVAYKAEVILANLAIAKNNLLHGKSVALAGWLAAKNVYLATTTFGYMVAQEGLNAALYACPITWIVGGIALLIGTLYLGVAAFNYFTDSSISATGIISGSFMGMITTIINWVIIFWNGIMSIAEGFVNVWKHPIYSVKKLFWDLVISVLDIFNNFTGIIDTIVGTDYSKKIKDYQVSIKTNLEETKPQDYIDSGLKVDAIDSKAMIAAGYDFGANLFSGGALTENNQAEQIKLLDEINKGIGGMNDGLDLTIDEIKYMRDIAEMEVINRFTTAEVKVEVGGVVNNVNDGTDADTIMDVVTDKLYEAAQKAADGVYD